MTDGRPENVCCCVPLTAGEAERVSPPLRALRVGRTRICIKSFEAYCSRRPYDAPGVSKVAGRSGRRATKSAGHDEGGEGGDAVKTMRI